jgi:hypothetical protein
MILNIPPGSSIDIAIGGGIAPTAKAGAPASDVVPFIRNTAQPVIAPHPDSVAPKPSITNPAPGSLGAWIAHLFQKAA